MNKLPSIGIIGGAGPQAGALLFNRVIEVMQQEYGCIRDNDFPRILLLSYPFNEMLLSDVQGSCVAEQLAECFDVLKRNDIDVAAIACNTLHTFLNESFKPIGLLNIIEQTKKYVIECSLGQLLVFSSSASARAQLHTAIGSTVYPCAQNQSVLEAVINRVLAGQVLRDDAMMLAGMANEIIARQPVDGIVLGCTEFSVLNTQFPFLQNGLNAMIDVVDTTDVLARSICKYVMNNVN